MQVSFIYAYDNIWIHWDDCVDTQMVINLSISVNESTLFHANPNSKVHGANMGPTWVLSAPDGPHVRPMNLAIRDHLLPVPCWTVICTNANLLPVGKLRINFYIGPFPGRFPWLDLSRSGPFYYHGLTLIPPWISNHIPIKMWDEITYPFLNFNGCTVEV